MSAWGAAVCGAAAAAGAATGASCAFSSVRKLAAGWAVGGLGATSVGAGFARGLLGGNHSGVDLHGRDPAKHS